MRILDPLLDSRWDERLLDHEDATVFHTAAWARVLANSYGYTCCHLAETDGDRFSFLLPLMDVRSVLTGRRGISLPFTDFCEPLNDAGVTGATVLEELDSLSRQREWKYIGMRGGRRIFSAAQPTQTVLCHELDLTPSEEVLLRGIRESTRRNIRKARREGVLVTVGASVEMVQAFYHLNCLSRRAHGLPPQPFDFFMKLYEHILAKGQGCIALATVRGHAAGGAVFLHFGRKALFKYGASDHRFLLRRPNDLMMWEAVQWHRARGFRSLSFGRTEPNHEGLRRFKLAWGCKEQEIPYYRYDIASARFSPATAPGWNVTSKVFRRLPLGVSRVIGSMLYRHVA